MAADQLSWFGGAVEIADFCPFSQEFSWHLSGEYQRNSLCRVSENQPGEAHAPGFELWQGAEPRAHRLTVKTGASEDKSVFMFVQEVQHRQDIC